MPLYLIALVSESSKDCVPSGARYGRKGSVKLYVGSWKPLGAKALQLSFSATTWEITKDPNNGRYLRENIMLMQEGGDDVKTSEDSTS